VKPHLLDVSTLVALLWAGHSDHAKANQWAAGKKLAVCPITELGFLRVVTSPAFNATMPDARAVLANFLAVEKPGFIPADIRALAGEVAPVSGKTTDWYLANLAQHHGLTWATLDTRAKHPAATLVT
jgi:predicted nucleic acid-binding protein